MPPFREMTLGMFSVFNPELGSTADTSGASVWFSGDDFMFVSVYSILWFDKGYIFGVSLRSLLEEFPSYFNALLGSTVVTSLCVRLRRLVFLVSIHLALCSFPVFRPVMLDIMASMDLKDSFMRDFTWRFHRCSSWKRLSCPLCATTHALVQLLTVEVPQVQLIIKVIYIPVATKSLIPMVQTVQQTMRFHDCSSSTRISHARC